MKASTSFQNKIQCTFPLVSDYFAPSLYSQGNKVLNAVFMCVFYDRQRKCLNKPIKQQR